MMDVFKQECKLCDVIISDGNFKAIEDATKRMFDLLLLKLTLDSDTQNQNVMCTVCSSKLIAASNFKSTCAHTGDILFPYINSENSEPLDLKEIYAKEEKRMLDDREVCRLCFQLSSDHKSIQELPVDDIQIFIPEIDFTVTTNPVICTKCHGALCVHSSFIKNCLEVEKRRNTVTMDLEDILLTDSSIKTEEFEIKSDPVEEMIFEIPCDIKTEPQEEGDTPLHAKNDLIDAEDSKPTSIELTSSHCANKKGSDTTTKSQYSRTEHGCDKTTLTRRNDVSKVPMYSCPECEYTNKCKSNLKRHMLKHKDPCDVQMYQCDVCDYKSLQKGKLKAHQLIHKDPCDVETYECDVCDYRSKCKSNLNRHMLRHKDPCDVQMYQCDVCDYATKRKQKLQQHCLRHRDRSEIQIYACGECGYESIRKACVKRHQLTHRDVSEVQMYTCDDCEYTTRYKDHLRRHVVHHKVPSEDQMYRCDNCDYRATTKFNLKRHQRRHRDTSQVEMYKCDDKSLQKADLETHQLKHTDPEVAQKYECDDHDHKSTDKDNSEAPIYRCQECDYATKSVRNLKRHASKHEDFSQAQMYKCQECEYTTRYKDYLTKHALKHTYSSKDRMYKCHKCEYMSNCKVSLKRHQSTHKGRSGVQRTDTCEDFKSNLQQNFKQLFKLSK